MPASSPPLPSPIMPAPPIRVFLVEDHAITLWGLQRLIESQPDRSMVVGTASSRDSLYSHPALAQADVLVMDLDLAGVDGLDLLPDVLRMSAARVLVLTASEDRARLCRAIERGAKGVMHKSEPPQRILQAIDQVSQGGAWLEPKLMGQVLGWLTSAQARASAPQDEQQARIAGLTAREREIVGALSQSPSDKLITLAGRLGMSENTLRNHLTTVYSKLGVRGRLELHVFAAENGLTAG